MTTPNSPSDPKKWQELFSATESHWQDLQRMGRFIIPIVGFIFFATVYAIEYVAMHMDNWTPQNQLLFFHSLYMLRIGFVLFAPLIAVIIGLLLIFRQTRTFIYDYYQLAGDEKIAPLIQRRLLGIPPAPPPLDGILHYPFIVFRKPSLDDKHWARWFGGPATLVIYDGAAVYLERGNRFSRVVGPGSSMPFLERHERIKEVVDLRPQTKTDNIMPWTKDGIRIKLTIRAECQINASHEAVKASSKFRFPFDPLAVKTAVERMTVRMNSKGELYESPWLEGAWGTITGFINAFVAAHSLDELFVAPDASRGLELLEEGPSESLEQILSRKISDEELEKVKKSLMQNGVKVIGIQIIHIELPQEVIDLRARYWESAKEQIAVLRSSRAEADRIRIREKAHAEAQRTMLNAITEQLEKVDRKSLTEPLILSLSGILDQGLDDPIVRPLIAKESFAVLNRVRKMLDEGF